MDSRSYGPAPGFPAGARNEIVSTDIKMYEAGGYNFVIAQAEVTDLRQLDEHLEELRSALDELRHQRGQDFAMLMVTDVVDNTSRLLLVNDPPILDDLPYPRQPDGTRLAVGVVSRKKQLLPVVLSLLEELGYVCVSGIGRAWKIRIKRAHYAP